MAERITMAALYEAFKAHEELDRERLANINSWLRLLMAAVVAGIGILVSVGGWSLNRLSDSQDEQMRLLRSVRAEVAAPAARP